MPNDSVLFFPSLMSHTLLQPSLSCDRCTRDMSWGCDGSIRMQGETSLILAKALICSEHLSVTDQISPSSKLPKPKEAHFKLTFILFPFRLPTTHWLQQTRPSFPLCSSPLTPPWLSPHASFTYYSAHLPIIHHQIKTRKWMHQCIPPWNDLYKKVIKAGCDGACKLSTQRWKDSESDLSKDYQQDTVKNQEIKIRKLCN